MISVFSMRKGRFSAKDIIYIVHIGYHGRKPNSLRSLEVENSNIERVELREENVKVPNTSVAIAQFDTYLMYLFQIPGSIMFMCGPRLAGMHSSVGRSMSSDGNKESYIIYCL